MRHWSRTAPPVAGGALLLVVPIVLVAMLVSPSANADSEVHVRVRGSARIEAAATANPHATELVGHLTDDTGRPVPNARVLVRRTQPSTAALPRAEACRSNSERAVEPGVAAEDSASVQTDGEGRFCLRWPEQLTDGALLVRFDDERQWLDPTEVEVRLEKALPIELAFAPPPRSFAAEDAELAVLIQARQRTGPEQPLPVRLSWSRGHTVVALAEGQLFPNEALRLSFSPTLLGEPGNGELAAIAQLDGSSVHAKATVPLLARVTLSAPERVELDARGQGTLPVDAKWIRGAVKGGSVEALSNQRTVGIAAIRDGHAELPLALDAPPGVTQITLRYLPAAPWWTPGAEIAVQANVARPSPWQRLPWTIALLLLGAWILAAWRRPRHREVPTTRPPLTPIGGPALQWVAGTNTARGWIGLVSDAHEGTPIADATVTVAWSHGTTQSVRTNAHGEFALEPTEAAADAEIRVEAPRHALLVGRLPPPGRLQISLATRRRELIARFARWAATARDASSAEPTPTQMRERAETHGAGKLVSWLGAVEAAVYGEQPVDAEREDAIRALEPNAVEPETPARPRNEPENADARQRGG